MYQATYAIEHPHQPTKREQLNEWAERDRIHSAIPKALWEANVEVLFGNDAIEYLLWNKLTTLGGHAEQYVTAPVAKLLARYDSIRDGIWAIKGNDYAKPINPRPDIHKIGKVIKYETAPGAAAAPLVPMVDEATAARYGVTPEQFWDWVIDTNQPIAITEGFKKALCLIAHGIPAIATRGITQWHLKGRQQLHPELEQFATQNRQIYIFFDQDEKPKTIANVRQQAKKLAEVLIQQGCRVGLPLWDSGLGKGIDDVLYRQGDAAQSWLTEVLKTALSLTQYKQSGRKLAALNTIERLNALSFSLERNTTSNYLPQLPPLAAGAIHVIDATMNTGKTYRIGHDWVQQALKDGQHVLVLSPLNSLGQQTAKDWSIFHIHDQGTTREAQRDFWEGVRQRPGIVLCPDSIAKIPEWFWSRPVVLMLDEGNQVTEHICQGDTFKSRYSAVLERVTEAATCAITSGGAIVLSEDGIPDRCVQFWQTISGAQTVRCLQHRKQGTPWAVTLFKGAVSGFRKALLQRAQQGDRLLITTTSQRAAKRLEQILGAVDLRITRIDSETNENGAFRLFFQDPDTWLQQHQPDILILSPSAKSGVSIEGNVTIENAYFSEVWGYFPALATDTHLQLLGRYRPPVPRRVFVPPFIIGTGDELDYSPADIKKRFQRNLETISQLHRIVDAPELATTELAVLDYLSAARAVSGNQKAIAQEALLSRLENAGHEVQLCEVKGDPQITKLWQETQNAIWQAEALEVATTPIEESQDMDWAYRTLDSTESARKDRLVAHKILLRNQFPGVSFDDANEVYQAICKDYGRMRKGVLLQAQAMNLEAVKAEDRATLDSLLRGQHRPFHRLPKTHIKAAVIERLGVLTLLNGQPWSNTDTRAIAIKRTALRYADEIQYWLRLTVKADQSPSEIANKLLKKLGLTVVSTGRPGKRNEPRDRVYAIEDFHNPVRAKLLLAACNRLSDAVSTSCKGKLSIPIQDVDTRPKNGVKWAIGAITTHLKTGAMLLIEDIQGAIATVSDDFNRVLTIPLSELVELS